MENKVQNKPQVRLIGRDGNAFAILGACQTASRKAKWTKDEWNKFQEKAIAGDYDHLLRTVMDHFDVS